MLVPPRDLDEAVLAELVRTKFGVAQPELEFVPLGEDSWCYRCGELWVSVRRDLRGHVPAAYEGAAELSSMGFDFVLGPVTAADGAVVHRLGGSPVVVFPYREVETLRGTDPSPDQVDTVVAHLRAVHGATITAPIPVETYRLPFEADLDLAVALCDRAPIETGPYGARVQELLRANIDEVERLRQEFRVLSTRFAAGGGPLVPTHGEPIRSNLLRCGSEILIADWGELALAPPERDWSHIRRELGVESGGREDLLRMYDIRWILSEIAEYVAIFAAPHAGTPDDHAMWSRLGMYLASPALDVGDGGLT